MGHGIIITTLNINFFPYFITKIIFDVQTYKHT